MEFTNLLSKRICYCKNKTPKATIKTIEACLLLKHRKAHKLLAQINFLPKKQSFENVSRLQVF